MRPGDHLDAPPRRPGPQRGSVAHVAVVAALAFAVFGVATLVAGRPDGDAVAVTAAAPPDDATSTTAAEAVAVASTAPSTVADTIATVAKQEGVPRLYTAGDSTAGGLGSALQPLMDEIGVEQRLDYKVSSGLTRDDFYDWPARLREQVPALDPDVVVVMFGGNDAQPISLPDGTKVNVDKPEWAQEYGRRVGEAMDYLGEGGRKVIWVGVTSAKSQSFTDRLVVLRQALLDQAATRPFVTFVDPWPMFNGPDGVFADWVVDDDGVAKPMRSKEDGFHLNTTGANHLARAVAAKVAEALGKQPPAMPENPYATDGALGVYKVQAGDAWARVASRLGLSLDALLEANGATPDTPIYVDQEVKVPTPITGIEVISTVPETAPATTGG